MMKRPMVAAALAFVGGVLAADLVPLSLFWVLTAALVVGGVALVRSEMGRFLIWPLIFLTGAANQSSRSAIVSPNDLRLLIGERTELVTVRGELSETPTQRIYQQDDRQSIRTLARVRVRQIMRDAQWWNAHGEVMAATKGDLSGEFFQGRPIEVTGVIRPPRGPMAAGLFDYRQYLHRQGIHHELRVDSPQEWRLTSDGNSYERPLADRLLSWSQRTLALGLPAEDESLRLIWAMTLGWKTALTDEVSEPFMRSGTMHIFAISGLHIALIAGILVQLLRLARVPRSVCGLIVIPLIWFYTGATGWQSSAIRSTIMMTVVIGGWSLHRPSDLINSLFAAAFIILVWDPNQLFQASFQLSFSVVFSIGLLLPRFNRWRDALLQSDPLLPSELRPRWRRVLDGPIRTLSTGLLTSLASWLGSMMLTAFYFHLITPVSLLANIVVVPLGSAALMCNLGSLLCGAWLPFASELFNHAGWFFMVAMIKVSQWCAHLPFGFLYVPAPPIWLCLVWFGALFPLLSGWALTRDRRHWTLPAYTIVAVGVAAWSWSGRDEIRLDVLPLSGGHAIWMSGPTRGDQLLVDCGDSRSVEFVTIPFLRSRGVNRLEQFVLTHGDVRHIGGATNLFQSVDPMIVIKSPLQFRSPVYRSLAQQPRPLITVKENDFVGRWTVLHPAPTDHFVQADDGALVLWTDLYGTSVLLLSDLGRPGQEALLKRHPELHAEIVITGLPAVGEPVCNALIEQLHPKIMIVADAELPSTQRASPQLRERLAQHKIPVLYCRESGAITLLLHPGKEPRIIPLVPTRDTQK